MYHPGLGIYKRKKKKVRKQENTPSFKKNGTQEKRKKNLFS